MARENRNRQVATPKLFLTTMVFWVLFLTGQTTCFATNVVLQWEANSDADLAGYKLYYKADSSIQPYNGTGAIEGTSPIDIHNQVTATLSGLDPGHAYYFAVTAYNTSGVESSYSNIVSIPELVPPAVSLNYPANSATVSGIVPVSANASDNIGVTKVEFYVNNTLQATDTSTPYVYSWNTSSLAVGSYTLMTKAYDAAGNMGQSGIVTVKVAKINDTTPPNVTFITPINNSSISGTTTVSANASDNLGVNKVEFYVNGTLISAVNTSPYSFNWETTAVTNGSYTLTAKAYDTAGNVASVTNSIVIENSSAASLPYVAGDINSDGKLDIIDAMLALRIAVGAVNPTPDQLSRGDVAPVINGKSVPDGKIDTGDAIVILSRIVGI